MESLILSTWLKGNFDLIVEQTQSEIVAGVSSKYHWACVGKIWKIVRGSVMFEDSLLPWLLHGNKCLLNKNQEVALPVFKECTEGISI